MGKSSNQKTTNAARGRTTAAPATPSEPKVESPERASSSESPSQGFWEQVAALSQEQWQHHVIYLYRLLPKVDFGSDRNFLAKYQRAIDEAEVLSGHGSGKYEAYLNDTRARKNVNHVIFQVYSDQAPPRVRLSQIVPCPENEPWLEWVNEAAKEQERPQSQPGDNTPVLEAVREFSSITRQLLERGSSFDDDQREMLRRAYEESLKLVAEHARTEPKAGLSDQLSLTKEVVGLVRELQANSAPPAASRLEQFKETVELMKSVQETLGSAAGSRSSSGEGPDWWERLLNTEAGAAIAERLGSALAAKLMSGNVSGASVAGAAAREQPSAAVVPASAVTGTQKQATGEQGGKNGAASDSPGQDSEAVMTAFGRQVLPYLVRALDEGTSGDELAHALDVVSPGAYEQISALGEEGLLALLRQDKEVWASLAPAEPQVRKLLGEFVAYGREQDEGQEGAAAGAPSDRAA